MARYLSTLLWMFSMQFALYGNIFEDLSFLNETDAPSEVTKSPSSASDEAIIVPEGILDKSISEEIVDKLLDVLGPLLSYNSSNNLLAQILIRDKGSWNDVKERLDTILNPFVEQNPKLTPKINHFKTNVLNKIRLLPKNWDNIKRIIPSLKIYCTELIDQVDGQKRL